MVECELQRHSRTAFPDTSHRMNRRTGGGGVPDTHINRHDYFGVWLVYHLGDDAYQLQEVRDL